MSYVEPDSFEVSIPTNNDDKPASEIQKNGIKVRVINQTMTGTEKLEGSFTDLGFINNVVPFRNAYLHFGETIKLTAKEHLLGDDVKNASEFTIAEFPATGVKEISTNKLSLSKFAPVIFAKTGMLGLTIGAIVLLRGISEKNADIMELVSISAFVTTGIFLAGLVWSFISIIDMKLKQLNIGLYNGEMLQLYADSKQATEISKEFGNITNVISK